MNLDRITFNPAVMGGRACIRGMRVTAAMIVREPAFGTTRERLLEAYPYLEAEDIRQAMEYAAWRLQERDLPMAPESQPR